MRVACGLKRLQREAIRDFQRFRRWGALYGWVRSFSGNLVTIGQPTLSTTKSSGSGDCGPPAKQNNLEAAYLAFVVLAVLACSRIWNFTRCLHSRALRSFEQSVIINLLIVPSRARAIFSMEYTALHRKQGSNVVLRQSQPAQPAASLFACCHALQALNVFSRTQAFSISCLRRIRRTHKWLVYATAPGWRYSHTSEPDETNPHTFFSPPDSTVRLF